MLSQAQTPSRISRVPEPLSEANKYQPIRRLEKRVEIHTKIHTCTFWHVGSVLTLLVLDKTSAQYLKNCLSYSHFKFENLFLKFLFNFEKFFSLRKIAITQPILIKSVFGVFKKSPKLKFSKTIKLFIKYLNNQISLIGGFVFKTNKMIFFSNKKVLCWKYWKITKLRVYDANPRLGLTFQTCFSEAYT